MVSVSRENLAALLEQLEKLREENNQLTYIANTARQTAQWEAIARFGSEVDRANAGLRREAEFLRDKVASQKSELAQKSELVSANHAALETAQKARVVSDKKIAVLRNKLAAAEQKIDQLMERRASPKLRLSPDDVFSQPRDFGMLPASIRSMKEALYERRANEIVN